MKWQERRLDVDGVFEFCGFKTRKNREGKEFEVVALDDATCSFWVPVFAISSANISPAEARKFKGQVRVTGDDDKFILDFLLH